MDLVCSNRDLCLLDDLERFNFRELAPGTSFGQAVSAVDIPFDVRNEQDHNVGGRYFELDQKGDTKRVSPVMPSMLTRDEMVIRQELSVLPDGALQYPSCGCRWQGRSRDK